MLGPLLWLALCVILLLWTICEGPVLPPSLEHLKVDSLVTSFVAWEPTTPPLDPRVVTAYEECTSLDIADIQSHESIEQEVHVGEYV
jgi:hypothetical protein